MDNDTPTTELPAEIKIYEKYIDISIDKFENLNKRFLGIDMIDLRLIGLIILTIAFCSKIKNVISGGSREILNTSEFIATAVIGVILLILGSYFRVKKIQEHRKVVEEASKIFSGKLDAGDWKTDNYDNNSPQTNSPFSFK